MDSSNNLSVAHDIFVPLFLGDHVVVPIKSCRYLGLQGAAASAMAVTTAQFEVLKCIAFTSRSPCFDWGRLR